MNISKEIINQQREYFLSGDTLTYQFRKNNLHLLKQMIQEHEQEIYDALKKDLNKPESEAFSTEIGFLYMEIDFVLENLKKWMEPSKVGTPTTHKGSSSYVYKEPYGVTLVIAPWNYPIQLSIAPMIGAIAAGNTVIVKPSEFAEHTSRLLAKMIQNTFNPSYITVVTGNSKVSQQLLNEKLDYIFFTGSTAVGKKIMKQASKHLTPVTLELGGKSPAIIDSDAKLNMTAKRIVWGKYTNAGQTCVAPDFLFVHKKIKNKLIKNIKKHIKSFYGNKPLKNKNYVRIINEHHFNRIKKYLSSGNIIYGGNIDESKLMIDPTLLEDVSFEDPVMQDEIFGPILPIITFTDLNEVIATLKPMDKPLALYYFGRNEEKQNKIVKHLSFGGGSINDTLFHLANPHLPFGGVGTSGMGAYHGKHSFDTFSHEKSILKQTTKFDIPLRYPNSKLGNILMKRFMK